jgi:ubiquinone/menaquinone biosynthesis C-methylase UbiE
VTVANLHEYWEDAYGSGDYRVHWDYAYPSQELVTIIALGLIPTGASVLDVGCGAGREAVFLAQSGFNVIGLDFSEKALAIAKRRSVAAGVSVRWLCGNVSDIPLGDNSVDFVNDRGCLHHVPEKTRTQYGREIARVLRSGGYILLRGSRKKTDVGFIPVNEESVDKTLSKKSFTRGPVLPLVSISDGGTLECNMVIARRI